MVFENRKLKQCKRCGHSWFTRKEGSPKVCGRCRSPYWNTPKKKTYPKPIQRVPLDDINERMRLLSMKINK